MSVAETDSIRPACCHSVFRFEHIFFFVRHDHDVTTACTLKISGHQRSFRVKQWIGLLGCMAKSTWNRYGQADSLLTLGQRGLR